jgi:cyclophilin family peptidyl-prolyl cis-trans isomerase
MMLKISPFVRLSMILVFAILALSLVAGGDDRVVEPPHPPPIDSHHRRNHGKEGHGKPSGADRVPLQEQVPDQGKDGGAANEGSTVLSHVGKLGSKRSDKVRDSTSDSNRHHSHKKEEVQFNSKKDKEKRSPEKKRSADGGVGGAPTTTGPPNLEPFTPNYGLPHKITERVTFTVSVWRRRVPSNEEELKRQDEAHQKAYEETNTHDVSQHPEEHLPHVRHERETMKEYEGNFTIGLFGLDVPQTTTYFKELCQGVAQDPRDNSKKLSYVGSEFHRIMKGFLLQGGDIEGSDGFGSTGTLVDENFAVHHRLGAIGVAAHKPHSNGPQFYILLDSDPNVHNDLNGRHVVFGQLLEGYTTAIKRLEKLPVGTGNRPIPGVKINITQCSVAPYVESIQPPTQRKSAPSGSNQKDGGNADAVSDGARLEEEGPVHPFNTKHKVRRTKADIQRARAEDLVKHDRLMQSRGRDMKKKVQRLGKAKHQKLRTPKSALRGDSGEDEPTASESGSSKSNPSTQDKGVGSSHSLRQDV